MVDSFSDEFHLHPHMRGENERIAQLHRWRKGLPPRVWGKPFVGENAIAAGAVHPHVRGENFTLERFIWEHYFTSPRVWKTFLLGFFMVAVNFIPFPSPRAWGKQLLWL